MTYKKREFARQLRQGQTTAEEKVWQLLRNNQFMGLKFRRQHVIEGFVVDFYCDEHRLAIEIDGGIHNQKMQHDYDELRQIELESKDVKFVRITNEEIDKEANILFDRIKSIILPSPPGRGHLTRSERKSKPGEGCAEKNLPSPSGRGLKMNNRSVGIKRVRALKPNV
jgi:very-short-patch-repair endonuclease